MSFDLSSSESLLPILQPLFLGDTQAAASACWALSLLSTFLAMDTTGCAVHPAALLLGGLTPGCSWATALPYPLTHTALSMMLVGRLSSNFLAVDNAVLDFGALKQSASLLDMYYVHREH